jgi:DNA gyrase subunit A
MQSTFGVIMLALVGGVPRVLSLKQVLQHFVDHRHEVVVRRSTYELRVAREREHILQGLKVAVDNIDEVVEIIRKSKDTGEAGMKLRERFELSERQSDAILNMRLARLTGLEIEKLEAEIAEVTAEIGRLEEILGSESLRMSVIKEELLEVAGKYGDDRRTEILDVPADFSDEDLIAEEDMVITVSRTGYVKRIPPDVYRQQRRGGRGIAGMGTKDDDWVEHLYLASSHDYLMCFTENGQVYWLKVYEIPLGSRTARGKPIVNLLKIGNEEAIASIVPVRDFQEDRKLIFATQQGLVKKTSLAAYSNVRSTGINAINVVEGDRLIDVQLSDGTNDIMLGTRSGMAIRFAEADVREMGRTTRGVKGVELRSGDEVVGMVVVRRDATLLTLSPRYREDGPRRGGEGSYRFGRAHLRHPQRRREPAAGAGDSHDRSGHPGGSAREPGQGRRRRGCGSRSGRHGGCGDPTGRRVRRDRRGLRAHGLSRWANLRKTEPPVRWRRASSRSSRSAMLPPASRASRSARLSFR